MTTGCAEKPVGRFPLTTADAPDTPADLVPSLAASEATPRPGLAQRPPSTGELCFHIGPIEVQICSDLPEAAEDFARLYQGWQVAEPAGSRVIRIEVKSARRRPWGVRRYTITGDGKQLFDSLRPQEVLPYIEWGINYRMITTCGEYLQLHAATLAWKDKGVILVGPSGCGKSTLTAALAARGWNYLSDEFALIDPESLHLHPFPKALCVKAGSFEIVQRLGLPLWRRRPYVKAFKGKVGYVGPRHMNTEAQMIPIRLIVFPRYAGGGETVVHPVSRGRAAFALAANAFNRDVFGSDLVSILGRVVRGARCVSLDSGGVEEAVPLIQSLLSRSP